MGKESDTIKSQSVLQICALSISCAHRHPCRPVRSRFIDCSLINESVHCLFASLLNELAREFVHKLENKLNSRVEEDADIDVIGKRYHKLALQLHPDTNKHPKAEIAFKLVLEAYSRLSDSVKRRAFNSERWKNFCIECDGVPYIRGNSPNNLYTSKLKGLNPANHSRLSRILQGLKEIRERFKEEARKRSPLFSTSDNQFPSNSGCRSRRESPIFDPSDYLFEGYPHTRNRVYKKPEDVCFSQRRHSSNYDQETARYDSPIFENRLNGGILKTKSTCVGS
uniref:J domain-containing protein n=1 Tax=Manihot esculenta TaxID=3983 RepID=A0A2C9W988_MANES